MYLNMIQIRDPMKRIQIINTCMASMEYIQSAKRSGVYSYLMHYISTVQSGGNPPILPGESVASQSAAIQSAAPSSATSQSAQHYQQQSYQQQDITMPRSLQNMNMHGIGATHPSLLGNDQKKQQFQQPLHASHINQQVAIRQESIPAWKTVTETPKQKAISYFSSCLEVLGIQEEVALTEETLKKAYKRMALRAHPDKGGSEEYFEAVTRAYAYLSEILTFMQGGKRKTEGAVNAQAADHLRGTREQEAKQWEHAEPVRLNAKNLDMNAFNKLFEQTHMPDPDSDGYGDWLKGSDATSTTGPKFKGEFNRDVFNRMFDDESKKNRNPSNKLVVHPGQMALTLNPTSGTDLVGERPDSYTAATNSRFQYTDLRGAYTTDSTVSDKVANVIVGERSFDQYRASRERAPEALSQHEMQGIREFESRQQQMDTMRERRLAEMAVRNQNYHDRMKQLVITDNAVDLSSSRR
jgi:curved DNA-binding protein CbpA